MDHISIFPKFLDQVDKEPGFDLIINFFILQLGRPSKQRRAHSFLSILRALHDLRQLQHLNLDLLQ